MEQDDQQGESPEAAQQTHRPHFREDPLLGFVFANIDKRLGAIESLLVKLAKQGELIMATLTDFAARVDTATNAIAATLADLRGQLDPAGQAVLDKAITNLEAIGAGGQPVVPPGL